MSRAKVDIPGFCLGQEHSPTKPAPLSPAHTLCHPPQLFWTSQHLEELCLGLGGLTEMCGFPHHHPVVAPKSSLDHSPTCSQSPLDSPKARWVTCLMKPWPSSITGVSYCSPGPCPIHTAWVNKAQGSGYNSQVEQESRALPPTSPRVTEEDKRSSKPQEGNSGHCKV